MRSISLLGPKEVMMWCLDLVLPPRCVLSGEIVADPGSLSSQAWQSLRFITAPFCQTCGYPFEFATENTAQCALCLSDPPPFASARSALVYDEASRDLILKFKHGDHLQVIPSLIPMLQRVGAQTLKTVDVIVPVPLHRWRLLKRRYNQAALLAWGLAKVSAGVCVPDGLLRVRATPPQGHKRARDRIANVKRAFTPNPKRMAKLNGKSILLVDDVFTTGATLRECAKTLLKAGAREVHVMTLARVVKE
jgi:ComF family protein